MRAGTPRLGGGSPTRLAAVATDPMRHLRTGRRRRALDQLWLDQLSALDPKGRPTCIPP
jgi:hypothetical protein